MKKPKLILLYGFASSGKTTLSKKYISEHPLALSIEGDQIINMMGQWRANENEARELVLH
jgi:DNA transposition AAA+ family ATPase